jgi:hypothetical protein
LEHADAGHFFGITRSGVDVDLIRFPESPDQRIEILEISGPGEGFSLANQTDERKFPMDYGLDSPIEKLSFF